MSLTNHRILEGLKSLAGKTVILEGEVQSVDEDSFTCVVAFAGGLVIDDVQLKALKEAEKGVVLIPKVGCSVQCLQISLQEYLVISSEEVDKILMDAETSIVINGGNNKGIPVLDKIQQNLDELKDYVMAMNSAIESGFVGVGAGSSADGATGKSKYDLGMAGKSIDFTNMENPKVKH
jgi:hypothetical protein